MCFKAKIMTMHVGLVMHCCSPMTRQSFCQGGGSGGKKEENGCEICCQDQNIQVMLLLDQTILFIIVDAYISLRYKLLKTSPTNILRHNYDKCIKEIIR